MENKEILMKKEELRLREFLKALHMSDFFTDEMLEKILQNALKKFENVLEEKIVTESKKETDLNSVALCNMDFTSMMTLEEFLEEKDIQYYRTISADLDQATVLIKTDNKFFCFAALYSWDENELWFKLDGMTILNCSFKESFENEMYDCYVNEKPTNLSYFKGKNVLKGFLNIAPSFLDKEK